MSWRRLIILKPGVTASYDSINDRMVLANRTTGDIGIAMEDVSGNFLAATGVTAGTLERGKNLLYCGEWRRAVVEPNKRD